MGNKKEKLVKTNWIIFLLWKRDRKLMKIWRKRFSDLKRYQIFWNLLIPNAEKKKKTLIMRKQLPFRGLWKKKQKNNCYLLAKWRTNIKFPIASLMKSYSGYSKLRTNTVKNISQKIPWTSQNSRENTAMWNRTLCWRSLFHPAFRFIMWIVIQTRYYDSHLDSSDFQYYKKLPSYWVIQLDVWVVTSKQTNKQTNKQENTKMIWQKVDNPIPWINLSTVHNTVGFPTAYWVDSDLCGG